MIAACSAVTTRKQAGLFSAFILFEFWLAPTAIYDSTDALLFQELQSRPAGAVASIPYQAQNTQPLYHHNLHKQSGLRAPVLRPSPALVSFYDQFPWVRAFSEGSGFESLSTDGALELQRLVELRYIALDTSRLSPREAQGWERLLNSVFPVHSRLSNKRFTILEVDQLPEQLKNVTIEFGQENQNYCFWGLGPVTQIGNVEGRYLLDREASIWLPLSAGSPRVLELAGVLEGSATGQIMWNGEELGTLLWTKGDSDLHIPLPAEVIASGANELTLRMTPSSSPIALVRLRVLEAR